MSARIVSHCLPAPAVKHLDRVSEAVGWTEYLWTSQARVKQTPLKCFPASHVTHPCSAGLSSRTLNSTTTSQLLQLHGKGIFMLLCLWLRVQ